jgi:methionyl aminopeptidase
MLQEFDSPQDEAKIKAARRLVQATQESLAAGIDACRPGACLSDIGAAIHDVADAYGYDTVQKYRGHGIAQDFHCPPFVKVHRVCFKVM